MATHKTDLQTFEDPALSQAFAALPPFEPPAALDAAIVQAAHADIPPKLAEVVSFPHRPRRPWWATFGLAAGMVMAAGVAMHVGWSGNGAGMASLPGVPAQAALKVAVLPQPAAGALLDEGRPYPMPDVAIPPPPPPSIADVLDAAIAQVRPGPRDVGVPEQKPGGIRLGEESKALAAPAVPGKPLVSSGKGVSVVVATSSGSGAPMSAERVDVMGQTAEAADIDEPKGRSGEHIASIAGYSVLPDTPDATAALAHYRLASGNEAAARRLVIRLHRRWPDFALRPELMRLLPVEAR